MADFALSWVRGGMICELGSEVYFSASPACSCLQSWGWRLAVSSSGRRQATSLGSSGPNGAVYEWEGARASGAEPHYFPPTMPPPARLAAPAAAAAASLCLFGCHMLLVPRAGCKLMLVRPSQTRNRRGVVLGRPPDVAAPST